MTEPGIDGQDPEEEPALIYDWNGAGETLAPPARPPRLLDETLRDGLQSPSVLQPPIEQKLELLHLMEGLGIDRAVISYPGAGPQALADTIAMAEEAARAGLRIGLDCAGRTAPADIHPIAEAQERSGVPLTACVYIGSSAIRQYVEGWDLDFLLRTAEEGVGLARRLGLGVMFVTEDTTRAQPETLRRLYTTAIEAGARRINICDTVGHIAPWGVRNLIRFMREVVTATGEPVEIDWHGHRDRGLDLINSIVALAEGADRAHGCGLGIGERVGNTPMELLLVNLKLLGWIETDLQRLSAYCEAVAAATGVEIPAGYPVVGRDAFNTSSGVHAAAVLKALRRGDVWLADRVYSSVPAGEYGKEQVITVGPMSGQANVLAWLMKRGLEAPPEAVDRVLEAAKASSRILTDEEIMALLPSLAEA